MYRPFEWTISISWRGESGAGWSNSLACRLGLRAACRLSITTSSRVTTGAGPIAAKTSGVSSSGTSALSPVEAFDARDDIGEVVLGQLLVDRQAEDLLDEA